MERGWEIVNKGTMEELGEWVAELVAEIQIPHAVRSMVSSTRDADGGTLLHAAARRGEIGMAMTLLGLGVDPWVENQLDVAAWQVAPPALSHHLRAISPLYQQLPINDDHQQDDAASQEESASASEDEVGVGEHPLQSQLRSAVHATEASQVHMVLEDIRVGQEVPWDQVWNTESGDEEGGTLVHAAARRGDFYSVTLLVDAGFSPHATDACGALPLQVTNDAMIRSYLGAKDSSQGQESESM